MRMTMTDSSTLWVDIASDKTSRANNLRNVGSGRSTPSENFENGLRLQVISPIKTLNYLSAFLCWALCLHVRPTPFLTRGADETQGRKRMDGTERGEAVCINGPTRPKTGGKCTFKPCNFCKIVK
jgi:hypothetical protein